MSEVIDYNTLDVVFVFTNEAHTYKLQGNTSQIIESLQAALYGGTIFIGKLADGRDIFVDMRRVGILIF